MSFLLKNYSLVKSIYLFIRCNKTKFFLPNTNITHRNGINKQNTHTKQIEKDNIGKGGGGNPSWMLLNFCFFTEQDKQGMTSTLF